MDQFHHNGDAVSNPARSVSAQTLSDVAPLAAVPKAIYVGTGGDLRLRAVDDTTPVLFANVASGAILPVRAIQLYQTGTTAADIVALF